MSFSKILKYLREEKQITQKELATACNLSSQCICALEQGTRNPTGSTVAVLATFFEVSADYMLGLEDDFGARTATAPTVMGDNYSPEERQLIEDYQKLNTHSKKYLQDTLKMLLETSSGSAQNKRN